MLTFKCNNGIYAGNRFEDSISREENVKRVGVKKSVKLKDNKKKKKKKIINTKPTQSSKRSLTADNRAYLISLGFKLVN